MRKIYPLSENIIAKIAAGEVIERAAYAVKELIENSIDAGADTISVYIEESGLRRIIVIDNGEGMSKEDLEECIKPHTTSKISSEDNLSHIRTLGFRGEALSSIASISRMTIKSKTPEEVAGTKIEIIQGKVKQIIPAGMPQGTHITIDNLFFPVPGRRKFLKSPRTEFRHIVNVMAHAVLAYPQVHFSLTHNKKKVFDLSKSSESLERIKLLLGEGVFSNLLPVLYTDNYISVSGFLTKPQVSASSTQKQYLFVNRRKIANHLISQAVKDAYGTLLENASHPVCILFLSLPHELVDVNVHPRKEEVRFADNQLIYDAVHKAVALTLQKNNLNFTADWDGFGLADTESALRNLGMTNSYAGQLLKEKQFPWQLLPVVEISPAAVIQIHNLYLVAPTKHGLFFVDQHAAHERILYEELTEEFNDSKIIKGQYHLNSPLILDLSFSDKEILAENLVYFQKLGFEIESFKGNTFIVQSVPLLFQDRNIVKLIRELLEDIQQDKKPKDIDTISKKMIAYLACRGAVKAGDPLTKKQAKDLLEKLKTTPNNSTCPHGRPTKVLIDIEKINKLFKRY